MTDIEIAQSTKLKHIEKIAKKVGLKKSDIVLYGENMAKIKNVKDSRKKAKVILVTSINPTKSGEGKTTVSIGLADAMNKYGYKTALALREPSLGPVFGLKGGATGGGYSQIAPMEDINLHFTGDFHAITSANNLICACIDNHIFHGNVLNIDKDTICFHRTMDCNDRALRKIKVACDTENERGEQFTITAACEIMAIMCLARDIDDLKERIGNITVAYDKNQKPVKAKQLKIVDACAILLKDAIKPNLVQTLKGTPCIVHLGPFANIAHGCNSIIATRMAMNLADYVVTEAGFGADLGAQKFLDIKCPLAQINPSAVVVVATVKALKLHAGVEYDKLQEKNVDAVKIGIENLKKHIINITDIYNMPVVCVVNKFTTDTQNEINAIEDEIRKIGVDVVCADVWGDTDDKKLLVQKITKAANNQSVLKHPFDFGDDVKTKIEKICSKIYGASKVEFLKEAKVKLADLQKTKCDDFNVVIAKTQYSLSDDAKKLNCPKDFCITIRDIEIRTGAKFIVAVAGDIMLMPGLNKYPAGTKMKIDKNEKIIGIF